MDDLNTKPIIDDVELKRKMQDPNVDIDSFTDEELDRIPELVDETLVEAAGPCSVCGTTKVMISGLPMCPKCLVKQINPKTLRRGLERIESMRSTLEMRARLRVSSALTEIKIYDTVPEQLRDYDLIEEGIRITREGRGDLSNRIAQFITTFNEVLVLRATTARYPNRTQFMAIVTKLNKQDPTASADTIMEMVRKYIDNILTTPECEQEYSNIWLHDTTKPASSEE